MHPEGPVAVRFAERLREAEARLSPLAARSSESRGRQRAEEDCGLRSPYQRDRDRIVHCKAFRRLKHKTQVFVAPEGDHYRTRLTHTLEAVGISRTVARALNLNEDLTEAIGLGHDLGHPPFGHAGEDALDQALQRRFGVRFRHNEHSVRVVEVLERDGRGLNLTHEVRDGILNHTGPVAPETLEGRIVKVVDRVAYINHDIDDALRAGVLAAGDLPRGPVALLGSTSSARIDALVHDLVETSDRAGDIVQSPQMAEAMLELRTFLFARVYEREALTEEKQRVTFVLDALVEHLAAQPEELGGDEKIPLPERVVDYVAGMTDRYAIRRFTELHVPHAWADPVSGRIADASVAEVKARADLVELVREHTELRQTGVEWVGRCPFHEERTASFSVNAADKVYYCFGCGASGDVVSFVENIQAVRFGEAVEWLADRYGVELVREGATPADGARRAREERLRSLLALAAAFYGRYLHESPRAEAARGYLAERGFGDEIIRRYGLGLAPDEWDRVVRAAGARGFGEPELVDAGLASRARGGRGSLVDRFRGRLMFPLHDGRGQVVAFGGRRLPPADDGPKYVNSPEGPLWHKGDILYGLHLARREIARQGHAIVVEGYTDVLALAQAGHQYVVASMGTSLTDRQLRELRRLAPRATLLFDADAAGADAALRGLGLAEGAGLTVRVATLPPGTDPGDAAGGDTGPLEAALGGSRSVLAFRVETALARHDLSAAEGRDAAFAEVSAVLRPAPASVEREELVQHVAGELRLPADLVASLGPGRRTTSARGAGRAPPRRAPLDATARDERLLLAFCLAAGDEGREVLERLGPEAFSEPRHREVREWILRRLTDAVPLPGDATLDSEFTPELRALAAREGGPDALAEKAAVLEIRVLEDRIEALRRRLAADDLGREEQRELTELVALVRNMQETATRSRLVR